MSGLTESRGGRWDDFRRIDFGDKSAENERNEELLRAGYVDPLRVMEGIFTERRFLVLGRKGTGKSALARHLALQSAERPDQFTTVVSVAEVLSALPSSPDSRSSTQTLEWLFVLTLYASLADDQSARDAAYLQEGFKLLEQQGLLTPERLARVARKRTHTLREPLKIYELELETIPRDIRQGPLGAQYLRRLTGTIMAASIANWHLIVIDGFEEQFETQDERRDLADLIVVASGSDPNV